MFKILTAKKILKCIKKILWHFKKYFHLYCFLNFKIVGFGFCFSLNLKRVTVFLRMLSLYYALD